MLPVAVDKDLREPRVLFAGDPLCQIDPRITGSGNRKWFRIQRRWPKLLPGVGIGRYRQDSLVVQNVIFGKLVDLFAVQSDELTVVRHK